MKTPTIAVLGAGPMGLAVAYQLVKDGHRPVVFEADDRLGGMSASFDFGGLSIERFYHFHCKTDADFLAALDELGIADRLRWVTTKMSYFIGGAVRPWGTALALLRFPGLSFPTKIRYGLHALVASRTNDWSDLDGQRADAWVKRWVGEEGYEVLWRQLFELKFHEYAHRLSAAWIWSRIRRLGRSRDALFREQLAYLEGGSETLLGALRDAIVGGGGTIRLSSPVSRIVHEGGQVRGVMVNGALERFDAVISTVPMPFVPKLLPDMPDALRSKYESLPYIAVVCIIAKLRKPLTDAFWLNVSDPGMDIPGLIEYSNLRPLDHSIVYVPYYLPGDGATYREPDAAFIERVKGYMTRINPQLTDADFLDVRVSRYRFAQPICEPNFLDRLPDVALPIGGVFAADTSFYYPEDRGMSESIGYGRALAKKVERSLESDGHRPT